MIMIGLPDLVGPTGFSSQDQIKLITLSTLALLREGHHRWRNTPHNLANASIARTGPSLLACRFTNQTMNSRHRATWWLQRESFNQQEFLPRQATSLSCILAHEPP